MTSIEQKMKEAIEIFAVASDIPDGENGIAQAAAECAKVAREQAIGFADWCCIKSCNGLLRQETTYELFDIYLNSLT